MTLERDGRTAMRAATTALLLALLTILVSAHASEAQLLTESAATKSPVDILLRADSLDDSAVGYGAQRTATYSAFAALYQDGRTSLGAARRLITAGSPAGRIYAYHLLRHISPDDARVYTGRLLEDHTSVHVQRGCIGSRRTVAEIVAAIENGYNVIQLPSIEPGLEGRRSNAP
jgi:hypothetical protein